MKEPETRHITNRAYRVETRATKNPLINTKHQHIGRDWVPIPIIEVDIGVDSNNEDILTHSYSYYAAIALAAQWLANLKNIQAFGIEARLVEYERSIDYKMTELKIMPFPNEMDEIFARAGYADRVDALNE